ncbi:MAG: helix-turn-helix transcriptional regulator [Patescibacteria group bacterium]
MNIRTPTSRLGKNIKRIREQKEMSQGDVCRAVGLDRAQMSNIESGKGNPTLATIEKIAQALGVTSDELLR